ncbi:MAG: sigma 54-interacting transcriptional regulator [Byssovorax sp.]
MEQIIRGLLEALSAARSFEAAAFALLYAALDAGEESLASSRFLREDKASRFLRAVVHLRPDDTYVRLVALNVEADGSRTEHAYGDDTCVPSATAWRWVSDGKRSIAIDILLGEVTDGAGAGAGELGGSKLSGQGSIVLMAKREVTHLYAIPLRGPGDRLLGMLSLEARCRPAVGERLVGAAAQVFLEALAAMATPYLTQLPATSPMLTEPDAFLPVIGASMQSVIETLRVFATQDETILLGGPTGTGKSRLARWCHERSPRRAKPFEVIDLATVPEELQMGELFGWCKGAFTGAVKDMPGHVTRAEGGTLFIDEIDKLALRAQAGLLRVLEERTYRPLGQASGEETADVRFIIGTNADLPALVRKGLFREDLYYRINVLPTRVKRLDQRQDEIVPWARYMLRRRHAGKGQVSIDPEGAELLRTHDWPGNLRQLDNIVRRAYALALRDQAPDSGDMVLGAPEIAEALSYEGTDVPPHVAWETLERAAEAFASEAMRRRAMELPALDMDAAEGLKAMVIDAVKRKVGGDDKESLRRAYVLLGKQGIVDNRNHLAHYRRESENLAKTRTILGVSASTPEEPDQ